MEEIPSAVFLLAFVLLVHHQIEKVSLKIFLAKEMKEDEQRQTSWQSARTVERSPEAYNVSAQRRATGHTRQRHHVDDSVHGPASASPPYDDHMTMVLQDHHRSTMEMMVTGGRNDNQRGSAEIGNGSGEQEWQREEECERGEPERERERRRGGGFGEHVAESSRRSRTRDSEAAWW